MEKSLRLVIVLCVTVIIGAVFLQVFARRFIAVPLVWSEEIARYAFIWMVLLAASLGVKKRTHFLVSFIAEKFPPSLKRVADLVIYLLMMIVVIFFIFQGIDYALMGAETISPHMNIRMIWIYSAIPVAAFIMMIYLVFNLKKLVKGK